MNRNLDNVQTVGKGIVPIAGQFTVDGSSVVSAQTPAAGAVFTVTKPAGTGIYRITLTEGVSDIYSVQCNIYGAAVDAQVQPKTYTASTGVVDLQVVKTSDGTAVDPTSRGVHFVIWAKNSTVTP